MYKDASYKEKYAEIQPWLPFIIETVKKDIKNEHLKKDFYFVKKYFASKNPAKLTTEELTEAYAKAIAEEENGEALAEFLTSRWLLQHTDLYDLFEAELSQISSDFTTLEQIDSAQAKAIVEKSTREFGAVSTYLFSVLNSVVFPKDTFQQLAQQAKQEVQHQEKESVQLSERKAAEHTQKTFEREIARLTDKYEKKLSGLQKKYQIDVDALKKQVAQLQRKLQGKS